MPVTSNTWYYRCLIQTNCTILWWHSSTSQSMPLSMGGCGCMPLPQSGTCPGLIGKKMLTLFNWPTFLKLLHIYKPEDAPLDWFALTCKPNPFTKAPFILNDKSHDILATGIMQLQENCPASGGNGDWVLKQFNSKEFSGFKAEWGAFSCKLTWPLNTAGDNHFAENNLSLQQIVQEHEDGVEFSTSLGPVVELCMKLASLKAIFCPEILVVGLWLLSLISHPG